MLDRLLAYLLYTIAWLLIAIESGVAVITIITPHKEGIAYPFFLIETLAYSLIPSSLMFVFAYLLIPKKKMMRSYIACVITLSFSIFFLQLYIFR